jgi:translation initiation factor 2B subunit (eIF-2B alpha/beta/delta family)
LRQNQLPRFDAGKELQRLENEAELVRSKFSEIGRRKETGLRQTILVVGYSSLIEFILDQANQKGKRLMVFITENRPLCEG